MEQQTDNRNSKLYQLLLALCKRTIDKTIEHKEQGKLEVIPYQYLPVKDIDYLMETFNYDWEQLKYFDFYDWRSKDFMNFIDKELSTLTEFEQAANEVIKVFKVPEDAVKGIGLFSLLRLIMKQVPNEYITYDNIDYYIKLFINDYESYRSHKSITWNIDLWLRNIYIESEEIEIAQNVFLRRPTIEQLTDIKPKSNHISEFDRMTGRGLISGAILSFSMKAERRPIIGLYPEKITLQIENWLTIFHLFKLTDVMVIHQSVTPVSIFEHSITENKEQSYDKFWQGKVEHKDTSSYKLYLQKDEEVLLRAFIQNVKIAIKGFSHTTYLTGNSYDLAFHRYNDSLLKTEVNAYKILSSITSLEALLSDGGTEITFKIRLRVAKLLSFFGLDALEVSRKMKDAYNLRSKLVHGSKPKDRKKDLLEFARQHTHEILNYNRICLLISLQLKVIVDKQKLITQIDNSFIDTKTNEELKKLIVEKVKIPIINPFKKIDNETKS